MKTYTRTCLTVALSTFLFGVTAVAFAQTDFMLQKSGQARSTERYGNLPPGAVIRTDERYGNDPFIQGPRGWHHWNRPENPKESQDPRLWGGRVPNYFIGRIKSHPSTQAP